MFEIFLAFGLDLIVGDPPYPCHPIRVIGRIIKKSELWLRSRISDPKKAGMGEALLIPSFVFLGVWLFIRIAQLIHPILGMIVSVYFLYSSIAVKDLEVHAREVYTALRNRKLEAARERLSLIVGRDTGGLSENEVIRGTVETLAESLVDGIVSPLFYAALGGTPLAMAYKAINTLDSMIGNRTERYREFGFAAAKLDEIVNWIPARISWFLIGIGAFFINGRNFEAWRVGFEDGAATSFPNSAVPEAAFAGALGVELGGVNYYGGEKVETPKLGYPTNLLERDDILIASRLMKASAWIALIFASNLNYVFRLIFH